jgi:hypothetical protein
MLFQSDYWLATGIHEKTETLIDFLDTDPGITTLVILEKELTDDVKSLLDNISFECNVILSVRDNNYEYKIDADHTKTIYVRNCLDDATIELMKNLTPIFAIFV